MHLELLTGDDALERVNSEEFQSKWKALYGRCPWAAGSLHPDFVAPWYRLYHSRFLPVVVMETADDGSLTGLLTLALRRNGTKLTGAGEQQAEYQGWIQAGEAGSSFIVNAIREIRVRLPRADICLKYLPPGIPLDWIDEKGHYGEFCSLRSHVRPVMRIDAAAMDRQRNKKNHRQNYNRLKRLGEVRFERVVEHEQFIRVFDEICRQYDFRQAALYRTMPFASDPAKKPFYLELHKNGLLHVTILTVGGKVAASHIGLLSEGCAVHLGINTYDPALAAHSPGNLLLAMLGVHLATEQMPILDLTPGGDGYKEHFATEHDAVGELTVYSNTKRRLKTEATLSVIRYSKKSLQTAGYRPADVLAVIEKVKGFRPSGWRELLGKLRLPTNSRPCELRYRRSAPPAMTDRLPISKNRLHDVFKFDSQGSPARFRAFSDLVMKRMERSSDLYSFVHEDQLRMFCWARTCTAERASQQPAQESAAPADSIVLFDLYVHRRLENKELVQRFVEQILLELKKQKSDAEVLYRGALDDELQTVVERCGFVDEAK
ncbi:GNAT family N-acetyltransferase [Massilia niabensis]|uniref:GNAT family N-acetyltransferase n=1 Tax=Massilia niabensis TaxID=544910 RepID=A0ABW0KY60_9BURK